MYDKYMGSEITSLPFWLNFLYFIITVFLTFYIPGSLILRNIQLAKLHRIVLSVIIGMVMWGIQGYFFGYAGMRFLSYIYLLTFFFLWLFKRKHIIKPTKQSSQKISPDFITFGIILIGVLIQLSGVWFMGVRTPAGLIMCCGHPPDNNLNLSLTNEIIHRFPPNEPGMFGHPIQNYHYWSHFVFAELIRVFHLPLIATVYQYMTILVSAGLGLTAIVLSELLSMKKRFIRWFLFFLYFSGELTYITIFFVTGKFHLSVGSVENSAQFLMNYPRAMAIVTLFAACSLLVLWKQKRQLSLFILFCFMCGTIIGFKIYVGIFAFCGLGALFALCFFKRHYACLIPIIIAVLWGIIIYIPVNSQAGGLFFSGFWRSDDFAQIPQYHLGSAIMALEVYKQHDNLLRIIEYHTLFFLLFIISTFGLKLVGILQYRRSLSKVPPELNLFLGTGLITNFLLGMFTMQHNGGANTFNFLVNVQIIGSFYAALAVSELLEKNVHKRAEYLITCFFVLLSIPRLVYMVQQNVQQLGISTSVISNKEIAALDYIRLNTPENSVILVDPRAQLTDYDGVYVAYLADRPTYFSGVLNELKSHGIQYYGRERIVNAIFSDTNIQKVRENLTKSKVNYLLLTTPMNLSIPDGILTHEIYRNSDFKLLQVNYH